MQRSILFYYRLPFLPTAGGVERVSCVLGEWLESRGHKVYYLSDEFVRSENSIFIHNHIGLDDADNFAALERFVNENSVNIIINQSAFFPSSRRLFDLNKYGVKIISVVHNSLCAMYSHPPFPITSSRTQRILDSIFVTSLFKAFFYLKYHTFLRYMVKHSYKVVVLSKCYFKELERFACKSDNVIAISNPVTLQLDYENCVKENAVCFVGRLSWQKRPDILLEIWKRVEHKSEWHLYILGDGNLRPLLEKRIKEEKIKNVTLEGCQDPRPYLRRAKILCLTSAYEGFPLVLFEAMGFGLAPIAFDTFGSARDIIRDGYNGCLVSGMNKDIYADVLLDLMENNEKLKMYQANAIEVAKNNVVDEVGKHWEKLFDTI